MSYQLKSISIELQTWGEYKGKYVGKICFENNEREAFMFNLSMEESQQYLNLISVKVNESASTLGTKLLSCLNLLPEPETAELKVISESVK